MAPQLHALISSRVAMRCSGFQARHQLKAASVYFLVGLKFSSRFLPLFKFTLPPQVMVFISGMHGKWHCTGFKQSTM